jgi:hypothetical protein
MAGVGRWAALVPGLVFVTSAYYILILYGQGDWPAFTGISMIPLMLAAGLSVLRAERLRLWAAIALAISTILFFGSHNITILLGTTTLGLTGLAIVLLVPEARRRITRRGVIRLACVVLPAALVSAWYLLPALVYASRTRIGGPSSEGGQGLRATAGLVSSEHLFTFAHGGLPGPLPVVAIAWVLGGIVLLPWGGADRSWTRVLLICTGMAVLIAITMTHVGLLLALPRQYTVIQFSYRLEIYVVLALCGAILAALALARRGSGRARVWTWMAVPVCVVSLIGAIQQVGVVPLPGQDRYEVFDSYGQVETGPNIDFADSSAPVVRARDLPILEFPPAAVHDDRVSATIDVAPGTLVETNIGAGSYLLHVKGATPVGVDASTGLMVLRIGSGAGMGTGAGGDRASTGSATPRMTITVSTGDSLPIVLGRVLSLAGLAVLGIGLLVLVTRSIRHLRPSGSAIAVVRSASS